MSRISVQNEPLFSRLKLFWALSRMTHGFLDLAAPAVAAVLCLGHIPPLKIIGLGFITAFSGYTAVYALNDVVDYRVDKEKIRLGKLETSSGDLDAVYVRHPMAQGLVSLNEGVIWVTVWAAIALLGAYALNPVCAVIFLVGSGLEVIYCLLLRVTHWRTLVSGAVKTSGAIAAAFAVDPSPPPLFLIVLFLWLFSWEIGGQNVPNDWADLEEDKEIRAKTVPVRFGAEGSLMIVLLCLALAVLFSVVLFRVAPGALGSIYLLGALISGFVLLLLPGYRLYVARNLESAASLFNKASYYPLVMLAVVLISITGS